MHLELTAVSYLGPMEWGVTAPQLFRATDGHLYVVKLCGNKVGIKALANESLAMTLGAKLGLCFPASGMIWLDDCLLQQNRRLRKAAVQKGPHFACRYLSQANYVDRSELNRAINKEELAGVMLFDHMLHNVDRTHNRKNLLIRHEAEGYRIYAIDHSHLFCRARWTVEILTELENNMTVNTRRVYGLLLKYYLQPSDFDRYSLAIKSLSDDALAQAVASIPQLWLPDNIERQALVRHLCIRRNLVDEIIGALVAHLPIGRRSSALPQDAIPLAPEPELEQLKQLEQLEQIENIKPPVRSRTPYRCQPYRSYHGPQPNRRVAIKEGDLRARYGDLYGSSLWYI